MDESSGWRTEELSGRWRWLPLWQGAHQLGKWTSGFHQCDSEACQSWNKAGRPLPLTAWSVRLNSQVSFLPLKIAGNSHFSFPWPLRLQAEARSKSIQDFRRGCIIHTWNKSIMKRKKLFERGWLIVTASTNKVNGKTKIEHKASQCNYRREAKMGGWKTHDPGYFSTL